MKRILLFVCLFIVVHASFAQPFTQMGPIYIPIFTGGNSGLFVQGPTGINGNITMEGNFAQIFWLTAANNVFKIGGIGATEPGLGAINIDNFGHVGINTLNTSGFNLNVAGTAVFDGITVKNFSSTHPNATPWADFVFDKTYRLPSLDSIAAYIKENNHLPGIPTAAEVEKNGLDVAATEAKLLEKIEQLTLYTIELQKQVDELKKAARAK